MYQVSVTALEKFRRFLYGVSSYDTEESVIELLSGKFIPTTKTKVGSAFHKIIECGNSIIENNIVAIDNEQIIFSPHQVEQALTYRNNLPEAFHEIEIDKVYNSSSLGPIKVKGRTDLIFGWYVIDVKTKLFSYNKAIRDNEYTNSYQWRYYLDMLELPYFIYDIFIINKYKEEMELDLTSCDIIKYPSITCSSYDRLEDDCIKLINEFTNWICKRKLSNLIMK